MADQFKYDPAILDVLNAGSSDWFYLAYIYKSAGHYLGSQEHARTFADGMLARMITDELIEPGDLLDTGFVPWHGPVASRLERVLKYTATLSDDEYRREMDTWFANTPKGNDLGEAYDPPDW